MSREICFHRKDAAFHWLILGDTGVGKSSWMRQMMLYVQRIGETAIVVDPKSEFVPEFLDESRGDRVLNAVDERCPAWSPTLEVASAVEAAAVAEAMFPVLHHANETTKFFNETARQIFAYLITLPSVAHPGDPLSPSELVAWIGSEKQLDARLKGTNYAALLGGRGPQRDGIRGSLNIAAKALMLLPPKTDTREYWSAVEWATTRKGWLFLTTDSITWATQKPLTTMWLDMLLLRLMGPNSPRQKRVWVFIDELTSLNVLPQLQRAITMIRDANVCLVLGFQAKEQLLKLYGDDAIAMLSQPKTKIFFRTSEAAMAEWIADTIGKEERERITESREESLVKRAAANYRLDRTVEHVVFPGEIQNLPDMEAVVKSRGCVTRVMIPYVLIVHRAPAFVPREVMLPSPILDDEDEPPARTRLDKPRHHPRIALQEPEFIS